MLRDNIIRSIASSSNQWKGSWSDGTSYVINNLVEHDGSVYIATSNNTASSSTEPGVGINWTSYWDLFSSGGADGVDGISFNWRGDWQLGIIYLENDVVSNNGSSYITTTDHTSTAFNEPGDSTGWTVVWDLMAEAGLDGADGADGAPGTPGADGVDGITGAYSTCEKLIIEMEMEFKTSALCYYKEFTYSLSLLSNIGIWDDTVKTTKLFNKDLTYNASKQLIEIELTRISDGATLTSTFTYNASNELISISKTATECSCSSSSSSSNSSVSSSSSS